MTDAIRHNKKVNLLAFLSMCLFVVTGFINILSWLLFMVPIVIAFYVYDFKHGCLYQKSTEKCILDYAIYLICLVELICCITSIYKPNSISATLRILLLAVFYFFVRTFIRFRSQFDWLCIGISCLTGILSMITLFYFLIHKSEFYSEGFDDLTNFKAYYRPLGELSNDWATTLLCLLPFTLYSTSILIRSRWKYFFILIGILNMVVLVVSFSRGIYIALIMFYSFVLLFNILYVPKKNNEIFILFIIVFCSLIFTYSERKSVITTCAIFNTISQKRSINGRFIKWKEAVSLTAFYPIVGVGGGNYILAVKMLPNNKLELFTSRSTNTYLQVLVEKGLLGFIVYGNMICMILYIAIKNKCYEKWITILFFSSFISLLIREMSFSSFFEKDVLQLLIVVMILVMFQPVKNEI